jgi:hypothetical protein
MTMRGFVVIAGLNVEQAASKNIVQYVCATRGRPPR